MNVAEMEILVYVLSPFSSMIFHYCIDVVKNRNEQRSLRKELYLIDDLTVAVQKPQSIISEVI